MFISKKKHAEIVARMEAENRRLAAAAVSWQEATGRVWEKHRATETALERLLADAAAGKVTFP